MTWKRKLTIGGSALAVVIGATLVWAQVANISSKFVAGELVFYEVSTGDALMTIGTAGLTMGPAMDGIVFEGATDDASETTLAVQDPTADITARIRTDKADTYEILTMPDGDVATGFFNPAANPSADVSITPSGDNAMLCVRKYLPHWLTVANARVLNDIVTDSGADETLGVAIYEDADAGVQLTEGTSADATTDVAQTVDVANVTLGPGFYRWCGCATDVSGSVFGGGELVDDEALDYMNLGQVYVGEAANACVAGNPPATTGALSAVDNGIIGVMYGP